MLERLSLRSADVTDASPSQSGEGHRRTDAMARRDQDIAAFQIPCVSSGLLSNAFGMNVSICDVTLGPTSSWKDCVAPGVVEAALKEGLQRVVVASSGNHGRAIAFACRAAGLRSAVLVYERTPADVVDSLIGLGADVFLFPDRAAVHDALDGFISDDWFSATLTDRSRHQAQMPGSDGYRRIAISIAEAVVGDPVVVVPTCYGDGASSIERHLLDLGRHPIMCLVRASDGGDSVAASIATDVVTAQVFHLLRSGAWDVGVEDCSFRAGLETMEVAMGKRLDSAEGGLPEAFARIAAMGASLGKPIVGVVTGSIAPAR